MDEYPPPPCSVVAWRPAVAGIAEVLHAHLVDYAYPPHCHDTWTVLIVDDGAIDYALDSRRCLAPRTAIAVLPPGVIHDGQPATRARHGFRKRNLYLDPDFLPADLVGPAVDRTIIHDPALQGVLSGLHDTLVAGEEALDCDARLAVIGDRLRRHLDHRTPAVAPSEPGVADQLRQLLDEHLFGGMSLADAAAALERSPSHLVRSFQAGFGVSPHAYVVGRRIEVSRAMLLDGVPVAQVAAAVGFYDQAHFTRHFKRHLSVTPGRYARGR